METSTKQMEKNWLKVMAQLKRDPDYAKVHDLQRPSPRGFTEYRDLAAHLLSQQKTALLYQGPAAAAAFSCSHALNINAPLFHLSRDLGEAFLATAAPDLADEIKSPLPSFLLNLPKGLLFSDQGEDVLAIVVTTVSDVCSWIKGVRVRTPGGFQWVHHLENHGAEFTIAGLLSTGATEFLNVNTAMLVEAANRNLEPMGPLPHGFIGGAWGYGPSQITAELSRLAINAILCLRHRPELQTDEPTRATLQGFGRAPGYRGSIRWLGRDYRRRYEGSTEATGTGSAKAPHWRRGHWHHVVHGAGRTLRRLQWFQPVYVNSPAGAGREVAT